MVMMLLSVPIPSGARHTAAATSSPLSPKLKPETNARTSFASSQTNERQLLVTGGGPGVGFSKVISTMSRSLKKKTKTKTPPQSKKLMCRTFVWLQELDCAAAAAAAAAEQAGSPRLYPCMYCGTSFPHQSKLTRHILSHSLETLKYREQLQQQHMALGEPLNLMESHFSGRAPVGIELYSKLLAFA